MRHRLGETERWSSGRIDLTTRPAARGKTLSSRIMIGGKWRVMTGVAHEASRTGARNLGLGLCAFTLMLDGLDNQILGLVMPSLMADWGLPRSTFAPFIIVTVVMMSLGTSVGGWLGDRFGRKPVLFASLLVLGALTLASAFAANASHLLILRGFAALGMGGVMPNATALLAEYVSHRHRSLSVSFGVGAIPLGGVLGGVLGSLILPAFGWRGDVCGRRRDYHHRRPGAKGTITGIARRWQSPIRARPARILLQNRPNRAMGSRATCRGRRSSAGHSGAIRSHCGARCFSACLAFIR